MNREVYMPTKSSLPDPQNVADYPDNPKAVMVSARGVIRVVERLYYWDKEKHRGCEKRNYLGYVVGNQFYSNDDYHRLFKRGGVKRLVEQDDESVKSGSLSLDQLGSLETKLAAEFPVYHAIAQEIGLTEDLAAVWGKDKANAALSIAYQWLHTGSNAAYLYESWSVNKLLPYSRGISSKEMSEFFASLTEVSGWRKDFFNARISRLPDKEMLSFDATEIAAEAAEISYAQYGMGKEGGYQRQLGLILLVGHESHMPVLFRVLPGNITDVTTVQDMLFRFDEITDSRRVFGAVVDRGYFSLANLARFVDASSRVIVAAKTDSIWIQDAIETAMEHLWSNAARIPGEHCWGWTVPVHPGFEDGGNRKLWVHVYRSDSKSHTENTAFYDELESFQKEWLRWRPNHEGDSSETCPLLKSRWMKYFKPGIGIPGRTPLEQDNDAVDAATRYFGIFCNVTTMECSAREAMTTYRVRDLIEKSFKGGKTNIELDVVRAHGEATMEGRFIIGFAAMSILNRLYVLMKQKTYTETKSGLKEMPALADEMTFNELKNRLATPRVIFDRNGVGHWLEVTKRQHGIAARLGFPDLYTMIPDWAEK